MPFVTRDKILNRSRDGRGGNPQQSAELQTSNPRASQSTFTLKAYVGFRQSMINRAMSFRFITFLPVDEDGSVMSVEARTTGSYAAAKNCNWWLHRAALALDPPPEPIAAPIADTKHS